MKQNNTPNLYNGLLNINKESGYTSNDVVARLRGILRQRKIGHTGTLDPDATGVLVVCLGSATSLTEMLTEHTKEYIACCRLGIVTDTQDTSGRITSEKEVDIDEQKLAEAVMAFKGDYDQIPPMYSAKKVGGRKLVDLARAGIEIERKPKRIHIDAITILDTSLLKTEHVFTMEVKCSSGTYIRTLCHDIGERLGCGAAMCSLVRTSVGSFEIAEALTLDQVTLLRDEGTLMEHILPTDNVFRDLDMIHVSDDIRMQVENGNSFGPEYISDRPPEDEQDHIDTAGMYTNGMRVRVYGEDEAFFGIYCFDEKTQKFRVEKFFFDRRFSEHRER